MASRRHTSFGLKRGFTLVELLVVIGIIALLISILIPALQRARERAQSVKCQSNMKTLANALRMFANDNKDHLPGNRDNYNQTEEWKRCFLFGGNRWADAGSFVKAPESGTLFKYVRTAEVYKCPSVQGDFAPVGSGLVSNARFDVAMYPIWRGAKVTKIKNQSYFHDPNQATKKIKSNGWYITPLIVQEAPHNQNSTDWKEGNHSESDYMANVHGGGSFYGAVDGSAQFFKTPPDTNSRNWWTKVPSSRTAAVNDGYPPSFPSGYWKMGLDYGPGNQGVPSGHSGFGVFNDM